MSVIQRKPKLNRAQRRKLQTRGRLMEATGVLLNTEGYRNLTVRAITEQADLGYGTFYLHFDHLDDAVWAVLEQTANETNVQMNAQFAKEPPQRRAYLSWITMYEFVGETGPLFLEMFGRYGSARLSLAYQDWLAATHETNMTAGAYEAHAGLPIPFQAQYMAGATLRLLCWWVENNYPHPPEHMAKLLYEMTYREPLPEGW
jgi:AcrR family transcriptional regulator